MNSYERVMNRLKGRAVDRAPNFCILMNFAAQYSNVCYKDFCLMPEKMVEANLRCREDFATDIVTVMSDPYGEAMDYGMKVDFPNQGSPIVRQTLWQEEPDATDLPTLTLEQTTRMKARVDTIALYAQRVKGECPIAGWVEGAVASYCVLRGIGEAMMDFASRESFLHEILDKITKQAIVYIKAQVKGGADIIGIGDAACSLLGPELYQEYGFVYEKRLIDAIHAEGALAKLHICGNTQPLLNKIALLNADIFDVDSMVDFSLAASILRGHSAVSGNLNPVDVLLNGSPASITREVHRCLAQGNETSIISGGCETPQATPPCNLRAVAQALAGGI